MKKIEKKTFNWVTPEVLEKELKIKENTQNSWRSNKKIPYAKLGAFIFYDVDEINEWIASHRVVKLGDIISA